MRKGLSDLAKTQDWLDGRPNGAALDGASFIARHGAG